MRLLSDTEIVFIYTRYHEKKYCRGPRIIVKFENTKILLYRGTHVSTIYKWFVNFLKPVQNIECQITIVKSNSCLSRYYTIVKGFV